MGGAKSDKKAAAASNPATAKAPKNKKRASETTSDFPRGGSSELTPLEFREISRQAEREVLFTDGVIGTGGTKNKRRHVEDESAANAAGATHSKSKKKSKKPSSNDSVEEDAGLGDIERVSAVESLSFKKLTKGALLLGCISAIQDLQLRVSLPNGLSGVVPITSISPELTALVEKAAEEQEDSEDDDAMDVDTEQNDDPLDLKSRFYIGQFVKCAIVELGSGDEHGKAGTKTGATQSHRIELTLMPEEINNRIDPEDLCEGQILTASIKSVEDRGYVLNTGISNAATATFLPLDAAKTWLKRWMPLSTELKVGQLVEAAIVKISEDRRSIHVTIAPESVSRATVNSTYKTMASVQPGQLIPATVMKVWNRGLSLRFMGFYDCSADLTALGMLDTSDKSQLESVYNPATSVKVRVLYVSLTTAAKTVIVSTARHIVSFTPRPALTGYELPDAARLAVGSSGATASEDSAAESSSTGSEYGLWPIPYGTVIDGCKVVNVMEKFGIVLQIPSVESVRAFCSIGSLVDENDEKPSISRGSGRFHVDTVHRVRVVGYDAIDGVVKVTLRPSVVNEPYFIVSDLTPGNHVSGTIKRFTDAGVEVTISSTLSGFIHKHDLFDTKPIHPELLFKQGKRIACRVLKIQKEKRGILLTCRKSLVQSKLPVVLGYSESEGAVPGTITMATVDREVKGGYVVRFYQSTTGFIPSSPSLHLTANQAVKCRILTVNPQKRRITATLNTDKATDLNELLLQSSADNSSGFSTDLSRISVGQVVGGTVTRVFDDYISVRLDGSNVRASVPKGHLSDHCGAIVNKIMSRISVNAHIPELVITGIAANKQRVNASAKPALIKAAKANSLPDSVNDIAAGQTLVGWVGNVATFGVFVNFPGSVSALSPLDMLSDRYVSAPSEVFTKDQTVIASVSKIEESENGNKIIVSLKSSAADPLATGFIEPSDHLFEYFGALEGASGASAVDAIGTQTLVTVREKQPYGLIVSPASSGNSSKLPESASGFVTLDQAKERIEACDEGTAVAACVLDIDADKAIVDCSLRSALVPKAADIEAAARSDTSLAKILSKLSTKAASVSKDLEKAVGKKRETDFVVEIVKEDYLVLSMPQLDNAIAFALAKSYNDCSKPFMRYKVGQRLKGTLVRAAGPGKRSLALLHRGFDAVSSKIAANGDKNQSSRAAIDPVDSEIRFFEDYQPGVLTKAVVRDISGFQANLDLAANVKGRLHISELVDDASAIASSAKSPEQAFEAAGVCVGQTMQVKILGWHNSKTEKFLPVKKNMLPQRIVLETTVRPSEIKAGSAVLSALNATRLASTNTIKVGQVVQGYVKNIVAAGNARPVSVAVILGLTLIGFMPITVATSNADVATHPDQHFTPGLPVEVQVASVDTKSNTVSVVPHGKYAAGIDKPLASVEELVPGARVLTSVSAINPLELFTMISVVSGDQDNKVARVQHIRGKIGRFDVSDTLSATPFEGFTKGQVLEAAVIGIRNAESPESMKVDLSLRPSVVRPDQVSSADIADPVIKSAADVAVGQVVHGYVKNTTEVGCFILIGNQMTARAVISELSDEYIRDIKSAFPVGKLVSAVVLEANGSSNRVSLSLRASRIGNVDASVIISQRRLDQINIGETLKGTITRIEHYGVFIKPDDSFVTGLCYVREIADSDVPVDPRTLYEIGDRVLAKVLRVDVAAGRLALGLKASYFAKGDDDSSDSDDSGSDSEPDSEAGSDSDSEPEPEPEPESESESEADSDGDGEPADMADTSSDSDSGSDVEMEDVSAPALAVAGGFQWDDQDDESHKQQGSDSDSDGSSDKNSNDDDSDDDSDRNAPGVQKKSSNKSKNKRSKMQKITQDITADLSEQAPKAAADFERLIVGSPNSSFVWLQFMAYYLSQSEVEQARAVAERALKSISSREEQEKLNVWVALLNLEHRFGTKDTLEAVLKRAVQFMNPKHVYLQMAKIHERADQFSEAENMHKTAISKFPGSCKVWVLFGLFYLKNDKATESRDLLARALKSLPKRKHIKAITQFGQMEFKHGEPERGRTIFEGVLGTYPKRVDLWSVYLDMEIKAVSIHGLEDSDMGGSCWDAARKLFARVTSMKHSSKKMKFFFKKWLAFEKAHGSEESVEHVKQKALEYVNSLSS
ncbi:rRNA biogenesis protein rrp5 [Coemansia sp. RSA 1721]|nr:rRNA biogenesis protein rrp5 [Coemansia sp. RSA 1721]